jgi:hypothetical protein
MGISTSFLISRIASAEAGSGTATRTISHPARAKARICATVAAASEVGVFIMDWTTMGFPPPRATFPTQTVRLFRRSITAFLQGLTQLGRELPELPRAPKGPRSPKEAT